MFRQHLADALTGGLVQPRDKGCWRIEVPENTHQVLTETRAIFTRWGFSFVMSDWCLLTARLIHDRHLQQTKGKKEEYPIKHQKYYGKIRCIELGSSDWFVGLVNKR